MHKVSSSLGLVLVIRIVVVCMWVSGAGTRKNRLKRLAACLNATSACTTPQGILAFVKGAILIADPSCQTSEWKEHRRIVQEPPVLQCLPLNMHTTPDAAWRSTRGLNV